MNHTVKELIQFHEAMTERLGKLELTVDFPQFFYQSFHEGEKKLYQKDSEEIKKFDDIWLETIESYFPSLDRITRQAKTTLRHDRQLDPVERAKKVGPEAVRHLASHSQYVKEITRDNVIPKSVLNVQTNIEFATYENRMIASLIRRLKEILNRRYEIIKDSVENQTRRHFNLDAHFKAEPLDVKMTIDFVTVQEGSDEDETTHNEKILERIHYLQKMMAVMENSEFMKELKDAKSVRAPLMKTQIILKNVDYNNAYLLWLYLDQNTELPFARDVKERNLSFDDNYLNSIYQTALVVFTQIIANQKYLDYLYKDIELRRYKQPAPKVIRRLPETTLDETPLVEDARINQYYLEQAQKHFEENLAAHQEEASTYEVALKRALRDTIAITNALYESYFKFETEGEKDVFRHLVKLDLEQQLTEAKHKARVARMIRETKEVDYKDAIRLEKRQLKDVSELNKQLLAQKKLDVQDEAKAKKLDEEKRLEIENAQVNAKLLTEHQSFVKAQNEAMQDDRRGLRENLDKAQKQFEAYEVRELEKAIEAGRKAFEQAQAAFEAKLEKEKAEWAEKLNQQKLESAATLKAEKARLKAEADTQIKAEKATQKAALDKEKAAHAKQLETTSLQLKDKTESAIQTLKETHEHTLQDMIKSEETQYTQRLDAVRSDAKQALEDEYNAYQFELEKLRLVEEDRLKKLASSLEQKSKERIRLEKASFKQKIDTETETLNAQLVADKDAYEAEIERQRALLQAAYRAKHEALKARHETELAEAVKTIRETETASVQQLEGAHQTELEQFKMRKKADHDAEKAQLEASYVAKKATYESQFQQEKRAIYEKLQVYHQQEAKRQTLVRRELQAESEQTLSKTLNDWITQQTGLLENLKRQHEATLKRLKEAAMLAYQEEKTMLTDETHAFAKREQTLRQQALEYVQDLIKKG